MLDREDMEGQVQRTIEAIHDFMKDKCYETALHADYQLSMLRLVIGSSFDSLHWFVAAEREVSRVVDSYSKPKD